MSRHAKKPPSGRRAFRVRDSLDLPWALALFLVLGLIGAIDD